MAPIVEKLLQLLSHCYQQQQHLLDNVLKNSCASTLWVGDCGVNWITGLRVWETDVEVLIKAYIPQEFAHTLKIELTPETLLLKVEQPYRTEASAWEGPHLLQSLIPLPALIDPQGAIAEVQEDTLLLICQKNCQARSAVLVPVLATSELLVETPLVVEVSA